MPVKEAVAARFRQICAERRIKPNELATRAGVTPSSVYSMLAPRRREVSVSLVRKLFDGLDMTLGEFSVRQNLTAWSGKFNKQRQERTDAPARFICALKKMKSYLVFPRTMEGN